MRAVAPMRAHLNVLTNSAVACFRRCPREYQYRYVTLRRPRRAREALRFGTFFHLGLNAWWDEPGDAAARLETSIVAVRARAASHADDSDPFELVKAEELLLGYTARWGDEDYETLAVERQFEMPLINPETGAASRTYCVQGKIDVLVRYRPTDKLRTVEHKTTSKDISLGADYWRLVSAMDPQVSTYQPGARAAGFDLDDTLYDVIRKVGLRPKLATPEVSRRYTKAGALDARQRLTDETPEEFRERVRADISESPAKYFARGPVVRLEHDEKSHAGDMWQTAWMMRESANSGRFPRSPNACERYGRLCDCFDVCSGEASIDDDSRYRTSSAPHEELTSEI